MIISQSPPVFAGGCLDRDDDGYYHESSASYCIEYFVDCNDNDPDIYPGQGCPITIDKPMEVIEGDIVDLVESGEFDINSAQTKNLLHNLQKATNQVENDKIHVALNLLNSFINQINAYINSGALSQYNGDELIAGVETIIDLLENT